MAFKSAPAQNVFPASTLERIGAAVAGEPGHTLHERVREYIVDELLLLKCIKLILETPDLPVAPAEGGKMPREMYKSLIREDK